MLLDKLKLIQTILAIIIASGTILGGSLTWVYNLGYDSGTEEIQGKLDTANKKIKRLNKQLRKCRGNLERNN